MPPLGQERLKRNKKRRGLFNNIIFATFLLLIPPTISFPDGAPDACVPAPGHNATAQRDHTFPYLFEYTYEDGRGGRAGRYRVRIRATGQEAIKGFLILLALPAKGEVLDGVWKLAGRYKNMAKVLPSDRCHPAVTHVDNEDKREVEAALEAPRGRIAFRAIVLRDLKTYWVDREAQWESFDRW